MAGSSLASSAFSYRKRSGKPCSHQFVGGIVKVDTLASTGLAEAAWIQLVAFDLANPTGLASSSSARSG